MIQIPSTKKKLVRALSAEEAFKTLIAATMKQQCHKHIWVHRFGDFFGIIIIGYFSVRQATLSLACYSLTGETWLLIKPYTYLRKCYKIYSYNKY